MNASERRPATALAAALGLGLLAGGAGGALAQPGPAGQDWRPLAFRPPLAEETAIIRQVHRTLLARAGDARIEVARLDADGDGRAELAVRLAHPRLCDASGCPTSLLRLTGRSWQPIFERRSNDLETGRMGEGTPAFLRLRVNGREVWEAAPNGRYIARLDSFGVVPELRAGAPPPVARELARAIREDVGASPDLREIAARSFAARVDLTGPASHWIAQTSVGGVCGRVGCPVLVLTADERPRTVARLMAEEGAIAIGRWPDGAPLIAAGGPEGVSLFALTGNRLVLRETTFPTDMPAPLPRP